MIRAEALFRKFQRLVEAIDKKQNFPAPRVADTSSSEGSSAAAPAATTGGEGAANRGKVAETPQQKMMTPELRKLLGRKFEVLPRKTVAQKGDGMPAS